MSGINQSMAFAEAALAGRLDFLDFGVSPARIQVYGGTRPAPGDTPTSAMLVQIDLDKPCGTIAGGLLTLTASAEATVDENGEATWARIINGANGWCFDCDASNALGAGQVKLSSAVLAAGSKVTLVSAVMG